MFQFATDRTAAYTLIMQYYLARCCGKHFEYNVNKKRKIIAAYRLLHFFRS